MSSLRLTIEKTIFVEVDVKIPDDIDPNSLFQYKNKTMIAELAREIPVGKWSDFDDVKLVCVKDKK